MKNMNILNYVAVASLLILSSFPALAQDKDSCRNDSSARKNDDAGSVEVIDFDIPFYGRIKNKDNSQLELSGMGFGLIYANTGDPLDFNVSRSIEIQPFCFYAEKYWQDPIRQAPSRSFLGSAYSALLFRCYIPTT